MKRAIEQMGVARARRTLLRLNQADGFDCQGCAWPDPDPEHRHTAEFCENGAKAVAEEATRAGSTASSSRRTRSPSCASRTDYWLGQQGRITEPMVLRDGGTPLRADLVGRRVRPGRRAPARARRRRTRRSFYTSGKTSNEAAFAYQLFARAFGTNNLPDCSNMCHESTSVGAGRGDRHRQGLGQPARTSTTPS